MRSSTSIAVRINGQKRGFAGGTVRDLLRVEGIADQPGIAVAINGRVIPRADWDRREPKAGDEIEIVSAVQGG